MTQPFWRSKKTGQATVAVVVACVMTASTVMGRS
jgi:hypothetical protein